MQVWSKDEALRFLSVAKKSRFYALYLVANTTGMWQGGLLALQWQDIDLPIRLGIGAFHAGASEGQPAVAAAKDGQFSAAY